MWNPMVRKVTRWALKDSVDNAIQINETFKPLYYSSQYYYMKDTPSELKIQLHFWWYVFHIISACSTSRWCMKLRSVLRVHEKAWQEKFETNTLPASNNRATNKIHRIMSARTGISTYRLNRIHPVVFKIFSNSYMVQSNRTVSSFNSYVLRRRSIIIITPQTKYWNSR